MAVAKNPGADARAGRDWVEVLATIVLTVAAVATAWSSYQATRWNGEGTKASGRVNALRIDAARAQGLAQGQTQVDIAMFFQWVNATAAEDTKLATFYSDRFRSEFRPAFEAWQATDPLTSAAAPPTPFGMDEYDLVAARRPSGSMPRPRSPRGSCGSTSSEPPTTCSPSCSSRSPSSSPG